MFSQYAQLLLSQRAVGPPPDEVSYLASLVFFRYIWPVGQEGTHYWTSSDNDTVLRHALFKSCYLSSSAGESHVGYYVFPTEVLLCEPGRTQPQNRVLSVPWGVCWPFMFSVALLWYPVLALGGQIQTYKHIPTFWLLSWHFKMFCN